MSGYGTMGEGRRDTERMADETKDKAGEVVEQAKQKTGAVMDQTRHRAFDMMDEQKTRAADGLGSVASALRQTGDNLSSGDQTQFGDLAHRAADAVERFSGDLRDKDIDELLYQAEDFARREPEVFLGGAVLLGLLAARFFKASSRRAMGQVRDSGRNRYEYGDRFGDSGSGYRGGIEYRSAGTGGYRASTAMGPGGYMGAVGSGATGWSAADDRELGRRDIEAEWMGDEDDPARKADSSQA